MAHTPLRMCHFEEFEESVLHIRTLHLWTDRSGWPVRLTNGKFYITNEGLLCPKVYNKRRSEKHTKINGISALLGDRLRK